MMGDYLMKSKVAGIVFLLGSLYYIVAEAISAIAFNDTLLNTYLIHTISELGIPNQNSPLFFLMNSAFILVGIGLLFGSFYKFKDFIIRNRVIFYILTVICSVGVIIVGLIHGGNPLTMSYHSLGAMMAILGGNIMLVIVSRSMDKFDSYQKITLALGIIGLVSFFIMFFNLRTVHIPGFEMLANDALTLYMPVFERLSVYTLIVWNFMTGVYLLKNTQL